MSDKLKRWHEPTSQWIEVIDINRIELMPPQEENSPKMLSAVNIGGTQTEITFDKPLLPFDTVSNIGAFYVLAEWYWVQTVYPISKVEQISTTKVRLIHGNISDIDGAVRLAYNQNQGNVRGENGYLVLSHFANYTAIFSFINIRFRGHIGLLTVTNQTFVIENILENVSTSFPTSAPTTGFSQYFGTLNLEDTSTINLAEFSQNVTTITFN